jgi:hypothetical protein
MSEDVKPSIDDFVVTLEMSVQEVNLLLNVLNLPGQAPTATLAGFITIIQNQAGPQAKKAQEDLEKALKASEKKDEPEATA